MKNRMLAATACAALLASVTVFGEERAALLPESRLWLVGDSTLHAYTANAGELEVRIGIGGEPVYESIRGGKMTSLEVRVPVAEVDSGKKQLDKNMRKALRAEDHPDITFRMTGYEVLRSSAAGSFPVLAKGELTVAGRARPIEIEATVERGEGRARIHGREEVLMTDHGVKPPTVMGVVRTHDRVVVHFDLHVAQIQEEGL